MNLVLGFAPFIIFTILTRLSADLALWAAFAAAFVVTTRDFVESPSLRLLDGASLVVFGLLALYRGFLEPELSLAAVRAIADVCLFVVLAFSLASRRPFSLQYANPEPKGQSWTPAAFLRANYIISLVWLLAFAVMAVADTAVAVDPALPLYTAIAASVAALGLAVTFTLRYPAQARTRLGKA